MDGKEDSVLPPAGPTSLRRTTSTESCSSGDAGSRSTTLLGDDGTNNSKSAVRVYSIEPDENSTRKRRRKQEISTNGEDNANEAILMRVSCCVCKYA